MVGFLDDPGVCHAKGKIAMPIQDRIEKTREFLLVSGRLGPNRLRNDPKRAVDIRSGDDKGR